MQTIIDNTKGENSMDTLEKMTKREFTELHRSGAIGLLHAGPGTIEYYQTAIGKALAESGRTMQSYLSPVTRADIDGKETAIYEDYEHGIIYVYTSYRRTSDGAQINHATIYGRYEQTKICEDCEL